MAAIQTTEDILARVDDAFPPERRRRALSWANTAEGRAVIQGHRAELARIPKPQAPLPQPPRPRWLTTVAGYAAVTAWWLLVAACLAAWLHGVDRWPALWGAS